jgi:hypothetical protein
MARELMKPQYMGRKMKDKRSRRLEQLELEDEEGLYANVFCLACGQELRNCSCVEEDETPKQD